MENQNTTTQYAGAEWVQSQLRRWKPGMEISEFGRDVANLLGELFYGIYHLDYGAMSRVEWGNPEYAEIVLRDGGNFSTFDYDTLARLVFLAHHMSIRVEIKAASPKHIRYCFSKRQRTGAIYERHPTLAEAVEAFEKSVSFHEVGSDVLLFSEEQSVVTGTGTFSRVR